VRYLRANDKIMAGDAKKIISNGTSAGGALSALLGSSGDAADYLPELHRLGAANSSDRIFAVSAYCPITNLEHADAAYEWQFNGVNDYQKISIQSLDYRVERKLIKGTQTAEQIALSNKLKPLFPAYVNSLKLKNSQGMPMTLTADGNGSFKKQIEQMLVQSAQTALNAGTDLGNPNWLKVENGKVISADFDAYARAVGRQKTAPAFDGVDLSTGENNLFGDEKHANKHFTEFGTQNSTVANAETADKHIVKQMNAMNYISSNSGAQHYRIRHGANDRDTSLAIPTLLALQLRQAGKNVDFALPWGVSHSGDYDLEELFAWAKKVSTSQP
ncbi:MAG: subtype B tannase, partial [Neisseria sp.]|nr:subtype B tannase [Neisseria sp.]